MADEDSLSRLVQNMEPVIQDLALISSSAGTDVCCTSQEPGKSHWERNKNLDSVRMYQAWSYSKAERIEIIPYEGRLGAFQLRRGR